MNQTEEEELYGTLVGGINIDGSRTARIELRLKPDPSGRRVNLLIMRRTRDDKVYTVPIFQEYARELAALFDVAVQKLEERVDELEEQRR